MKTRYNLRPASSRSSMKALKRPVHRRHSLRLNPVIKQEKSRVPSAIEPAEEPPTSPNDDLNELLARHHRRMLEEQKDRKLYERYVRDQRTLRRLQCRRTHTAHLSEATRTRLLRELERERRYTVHDQICSHLANHLLTFRHGIHSEAMDWSTLEEQICRRAHSETLRQYDVMITNLKKVSSSNSKTSSSKPRLSVHERKKQRLAATNDNPVSNSSPEEKTASTWEHLLPTPTVRFVTDSHSNVRTANSQHLTCIQNVLSSSSRSSSPILRLRPKSSNLLVGEPTKKRPLEKENCSSTTTTHGLRSYPNTRKHPMIFFSRRQKRLRSMNGND